MDDAKRGQVSFRPLRQVSFRPLRQVSFRPLIGDLRFSIRGTPTDARTHAMSFRVALDVFVVQ